ncbi:MAG: hypothetical protein AB2A00_10010 [Myxococcota bacterium]
MAKMQGGLAPLEYASAERGKRWSLDEWGSYREYCSRNPQGHALFARRWKYDFVPFRGGLDLLFGDPRRGKLKPDDPMSLLGVFSKTGLVFGFACETEEYHHRNRYERSLVGRHISYWVGRDASKYLPGVYWLTVVSRPRLAAAELGTESLGAVGKVLSLGADHVALQAFDKPADWLAHSERLDRFCHDAPGVFSLQRIRAGLDRLDPGEALDEAVKGWR